MGKETTIRDEIHKLKDLVSAPSNEKKRKKIKPFKLPFKARVNKSKLQQGYLTVAVINDNMGVDFRKELIKDGTVKLDDTFHAVEEFDIFNYKGKPFIFQAKSKLNPYNPLTGDNETYGQPYIMARMEGDRLTTKKKIGLGISIGVLIIVGVIVYALFTGGA
tara:strand:+ start:2466 stop:2951 length:486 start_codon:yes stop_codon:yes gene_type:complete